MSFGAQLCLRCKRKYRMYVNQHRAKKAALGICMHCTKPVAAGKSRCQHHLAYEKARYARRKHENREA